MKLLIYQGGGYEGCFWEWNACLFDADGNFEDLFSSGRDGVKSASAFEDRFSSFDDPQDDDRECWIYDIESEEEMDQLVKDKWNPSILLTLIETLDGRGKFYVKCDYCGGSFSDYNDVEADGYRGCGGLASCATGIICHECYSSHTCDYCGEWLDEDDWRSEDGDCAACTAELMEQDIRRHQAELKRMLPSMFHNLNSCSKLNKKIIQLQEELELFEYERNKR